MALTDDLIWYGHLTETGTPVAWADAADDLGPFVNVGAVTASSSGVQTTAANYLRPLINNAFDLDPADGLTWAGFVSATGRSIGIALGIQPSHRLTYLLELGNPPDLAVFYVCNGSFFTPVASVQAAFADDGTEQFIAVWIDRATDVIGIRVGGTTVTAAFSAALTLFGVGASLGGSAFLGAAIVGPKWRNLGFWARPLTTAELDSLAAGTLPLAVPDPVEAGESSTIGTPANGEAALLYYLLGDETTIPTGDIWLFIDKEYIETLGQDEGTGFYVLATTIDTARLAIGDHEALIEILTLDTSAEQPEWSREIHFTTSEILPRAAGIDSICVEPNGTATIRYRGLMTDNTAYTPAPWAITWDGLGSNSGTTFTAGAVEGQGYTTPGRNQVLVRQNRGIAHFGPMPGWTVRYGYESGSKLTVSIYSFGPQEFQDAAYGLTVRDQMLTAGLCLEFGGWLPPNPVLSDPATVAAWFLPWNQVLTVDYPAYFSRWTGGVLLTGDDLWGQAFTWLENAVTHPGLIADVMAQHVDIFATWSSDIRGTVAVDEVNFRYGDDPTFTGELSPGYAPLAPLESIDGGLATLVEMARDAGAPPMSWGLFGLTSEPPRDYTGWTLPAYSDWIDQYQSNVVPTSRTYGSHLRTDNLTALQYAGRIRDPARPFSTNYSLTRSFGTKQVDGSVPIYGRTQNAYSLGGIMWLSLFTGASLIRGYFLERFQLLAEIVAAVTDALIQRAVRPGDDLWDTFLAHATAIQDHAAQLLGVETSHPWGGPDFATMYRTDGTQGNIYVAVNLSRLSAQLPPWAFEESLGPIATAEIIDGDTRTAIDPADTLASPPSIPGGGVLILSGTTPATVRGRSRSYGPSRARFARQDCCEVYS